LIAIYDAMQTWGSVEYVLPHTYLHWDWLWNSKMKKLYVPEPVEIRSYTELFKKYKSIHSDVGVGVMLTNVKTGARSKIVSPRYLEIKEIRGNNPNLLFQYLTLVHIRKECHFLQFFPWYKSTFDHFNRLYSNFIINLFECYLNRYVRRTGEVISKKYMPHIYQIHHTIYLPAKKDPNAHIKRITLQEVMDYVKNMNPIDMYKSMTT
jgi:hypothetical protein